jgi:hypothetical protein
MLLYLDVDNKERFKVPNDDVRVKDLAKSVKRGERGVHLDIKNLGVLSIEDIIIDFKGRSAIFKTRLLLDYREQNDDLPYNHDIIVMEDEFWTSQMI